MKKILILSSIFLASCSKEDFEISPTSEVQNSSNYDPLSFPGYKVSPAAKSLGVEYWRNLPVMSDLMIPIFQKGINKLPDGTYDYASMCGNTCLGDFNNDGWVDIFNPGQAMRGKAANLAFLIWNPSQKIFEEKNLLSCKSDFIGGPTASMAVYLNSDNYVDVVIFGHIDEGLAHDGQNPPNEPVTLCLSNGSGGYELVRLTLEPSNLSSMFTHEGGDLGDANGDGILDLLIVANSHAYIFWGRREYPYFSNLNFAHFASDTTNFRPNNSFGEVVPEGSGFAFIGKLLDINRDGKKDFVIGTGESKSRGFQHRFLSNFGNGRFTNSGVTKLPYNGISENLNINDFITDDINSDGVNDIIGINSNYGQDWNLVAYLGQRDGTFKIDNSLIKYTINSSDRKNWKKSLIYYDFNGDGKKDISYRDSGAMAKNRSDNDLKKKTVFIRSGNQFIETDFYSLDPFAKYLRYKYFN